MSFDVFAIQASLLNFFNAYVVFPYLLGLKWYWVTTSIWHLVNLSFGLLAFGHFWFSLTLSFSSTFLQNNGTQLNSTLHNDPKPNDTECLFCRCVIWCMTLSDVMLKRSTLNDKFSIFKHPEHSLVSISAQSLKVDKSKNWWIVTVFQVKNTKTSNLKKMLVWVEYFKCSEHSLASILTQ